VRPFVITSNPDAIRRLFGYVHQPNFPPRYNIAPTQPIPVVLMENGTCEFHLMRWAFLPGWVKDPRNFSILINARAETVTEKPAFKNAIRRRRCLIPADGYYEWRPDDKLKRPLFIYPRNGQPIAFAALWESWNGPNGEEVDTVAIITTEASEDLRALHHRMPVVISPDNFEFWLDCRVETEASPLDLLRPAPQGTFDWYEVSMKVNRVVNDDAGLVQRITPEQAQAEEDAVRKPVRAKAPAKVVASNDDQGSLF
jgi:putative SOS response-associated peptidase YedK